MFNIKRSSHSAQELAGNLWNFLMVTNEEEKQIMWKTLMLTAKNIKLNTQSEHFLNQN